MDTSVVVAGCSFASFLCGFCPGISEDKEKGRRRRRCLKIFIGVLFIIVDYTDFILDLKLSGTLIKGRENELSWGLWMGCSAIYGGLFYVYSAAVAANSIRPNETNFAIQMSMSCAVELSLFLIEDMTTVMVYTREDGAFDRESIGDVMNVFTTTTSAAIVFFGTIPLTIRMWNSAFGRKRIIFIMIGPLIAVVFYMYLLVGRVYMGVPLGNTLRIISFVLYVPFHIMGYIWVYWVHNVFPFMDEYIDLQEIKTSFLAIVSRTVGEEFLVCQIPGVLYQFPLTWSCGGQYEQRRCEIQFPKEVSPDNNNVHLRVYLLKIEEVDDQTSLMTRALEMNYLHLRTRGGRLSLDEGNAWVVYSYMDSVVGKSESDFQEMLESFLRWARSLHDYLKSGESIAWRDSSMLNDKKQDTTKDAYDYQELVDLVVESYHDREGGICSFMPDTWGEFCCKEKPKSDEKKNTAHFEYGRSVKDEEFNRYEDKVSVSWHFSDRRSQFVMASNLVKLDGSADDAEIMKRALGMNFTLKNSNHACIVVKTPADYSATLGLNTETNDIVLSFMDRIDKYSGVRFRRSHLIFKYTASDAALKLRGWSGEKDGNTATRGPPALQESRKPEPPEERCLEEIISSLLFAGSDTSAADRDETAGVARIVVAPAHDDEADAFEDNDTEVFYAALESL